MVGGRFFSCQIDSKKTKEFSDWSGRLPLNETDRKVRSTWAQHSFQNWTKKLSNRNRNSSSDSEGLSRKFLVFWHHHNGGCHGVNTWVCIEDMGAYGVDIGSNIGELLLRLSDALPPNVTQLPIQWWLVGGFKYLLFSPLPGKWSNLTNIFQMGWNHQLDEVLNP